MLLLQSYQTKSKFEISGHNQLNVILKSLKSMNQFTNNVKTKNYLNTYL